MEMSELKRVRWEGHIGRMREKRNKYRFMMGN
jgi:hypothetical protein